MGQAQGDAQQGPAPLPKPPGLALPSSAPVGHQIPDEDRSRMRVVAKSSCLS